MNGCEVANAGQGVSGREVARTQWKTIRHTFHSFANLNAHRGTSVGSPKIECHGLQWKIKLYPGGEWESSESATFVSIFLSCESSTEVGKDVRASYTIRSPTARGPPLAWSEDGPYTFGTSSFTSWGDYDCVLREDVLHPMSGFLVNGNLTIEVDIQVVLDTFPWSANAKLEATSGRLDLVSATLHGLKKEHRQMKSLSVDMLQLLDSEESSDVTFEVGRNAEGQKKKIFNVHRLVLSTRCPVLASLVEDCNVEGPIPIEDIDPNMFLMLLRFLYGGEVPGKNVLKKDAQAIIRAADRFGCTGLKLHVEAELAWADISANDVAELILFADATNCALLKEAAMDVFVGDIEGVIASKGYDQVKESPSIMAEMMAAMASANKKRPASNNGDSD